MQHDFYTFMNQLNHTALDATRQLIEINHQSGKKMVKSQFDALDLYLDSGAKLARLNREYDDMPGYLAAQNSIRRQRGERDADDSVGNTRGAGSVGRAEHQAACRPDQTGRESGLK